MEKVTRVALGVLLRAAPVGLAYVLLTPSVWTGSNFSALWFAAAFVAGGAVREESRATARVESWPAWLGSRLFGGLGLASLLVACLVLLSAVFGERTLHATDQRIIFTVTSLIAVAWWVLPSRHQRRAVELKSAERRAEIRTNIRREIEAIETSAKTEQDINQSD